MNKEVRKSKGIHEEYIGGFAMRKGMGKCCYYNLNLKKEKYFY